MTRLRNELQHVQSEMFALLGHLQFMHGRMVANETAIITYGHRIQALEARLQLFRDGSFPSLVARSAANGPAVSTGILQPPAPTSAANPPAVSTGAVRPPVFTSAVPTSPSSAIPGPPSTLPSRSPSVEIIDSSVQDHNTFRAHMFIVEIHGVSMDSTGDEAIIPVPETVREAVAKHVEQWKPFSEKYVGRCAHKHMDHTVWSRAEGADAGCRRCTNVGEPCLRIIGSRRLMLLPLLECLREGLSSGDHGFWIRSVGNMRAERTKPELWVGSRGGEGLYAKS